MSSPWKDLVDSGGLVDAQEYYEAGRKYAREENAWLAGNWPEPTPPDLDGDAQKEFERGYEYEAFGQPGEPRYHVTKRPPQRR